MELRKYETMFILRPTLTEEEVKKFIERINNLVTENKGKIEEEPKYFKRNLAYAIKKNSSGYYFIFNYEVPSDFNKILSESLKYDEDVLRYMPVVQE